MTDSPRGAGFTVGPARGGTMPAALARENYPDIHFFCVLLLMNEWGYYWPYGSAVCVSPCRPGMV